MAYQGKHPVIFISLKDVKHNSVDESINKIKFIMSEVYKSFSGQLYSDKIKANERKYIDLIIKNPLVPSFIAWELTREPNWIIQSLKQRNLNFEKLTIQIADEVKIGKIIPFKLEDLFVNILGLCAFPFVTKPVLLEFFFNQDEEELSLFMASRKIEVKRILRNWLKPD